MTTDDSEFFGPTEEEQFGDWLHWAEQLVNTILLASQRTGLAIAAAGFAIAGANMMHYARTLGVVSLVVAAVFGLWAGLASAKGVR